MPHSAISYAVFVPLVLLVLYRRFRRNFGRQRLSPAWLWWRVALLALATSGLLLIGATGVLAGAKTGLAALAGLACGGVLAVFGLRLTRFESTAAGRFYTPDPWFGVALSALMLGRLAYRFIVVRAGAATVAAADPTGLSMLHRSPLTLAIAALLVGYWLAYCIGLLRAARAPATTAA